MLITEAIPKPTFANHESFHLRYSWLKKAYDSVQKNDHIFSSDDATVKLGVGKNMVRAIRFWAMAHKILYTKGSGANTTTHHTDMGYWIFNEKSGLDPYLENPNTLWLLHWLLYAKPCKIPVWWIIMNEFSTANTKIKDVTDDVILRVTNTQEWKTPSEKSIKKDVNVFINTYSTRHDKVSMEDYLDCPFRQLHMIKQRSRETIQFVFGKKFGLSPEIVAFACLDFMVRAGITAQTISISKLASDAGGVGNTFKLFENDIVELLGHACDKSDSLRMQNIAGVQNLVLDDSPEKISLDMLTKVYNKKNTLALPVSKNGVIA